MVKVLKMLKIQGLTALGLRHRHVPAWPRRAVTPAAVARLPESRLGVYDSRVLRDFVKLKAVNGDLGGRTS